MGGRREGGGERLKEAPARQGKTGPKSRDELERAFVTPKKQDPLPARRRSGAISGGPGSLGTAKSGAAERPRWARCDKDPSEGCRSLA